MEARVERYRVALAAVDAARAYDDFYVVIATVIPVLYIVAAFQLSVYQRLMELRASETTRIALDVLDDVTALFRVATAGLVVPVGGMAPFVRMLVFLSPIIFTLLPATSIVAAAVALMTNTDHTWMRVWAFSGLVTVVIYVTTAAVQPQARAARDDLAS